MAMKCFGIMGILLLAIVMSALANSSALQDQNPKSEDFESDGLEQKVYVSSGEQEDRSQSQESDEEANFDKFRPFNWGSRGRNQPKPRCAAKIGSGSCRSQRDCLPGEQCRYFHEKHPFRFLIWRISKCCVRRPTTSSATTRPTPSMPVTYSESPATTRPTPSMPVTYSESPATPTIDDAITTQTRNSIITDATTDIYTLPTGVSIV